MSLWKYQSTGAPMRPRSGILGLAKRVYLSHTTLNKLFRAELGMTIGKCIDDQLLMQAKALLFYSRFSVAEVSARLGFSDQFYFSRRFKACSGFTPLQYRKTHTVPAANQPIASDRTPLCL